MQYNIRVLIHPVKLSRLKLIFCKDLHIVQFYHHNKHRRLKNLRKALAMQKKLNLAKYYPKCS